MAFTEIQEKALKAKLNGKYVRTREHDGMTLSYIEGWHAIAEANRIFGFDGWSRETVHASCVWQGVSRGMKACSYVARVRVTVRAGETTLVREGCGSGHGRGQALGEAHESAIKEAETDAMKRALMTFGNPFGLALYDREQKSVRRVGTKSKGAAEPKPIEWVVYSATGEPLGTHGDPVAYCSALRKTLEAIDAAEEATAFWKRNQDTVALLRRMLPDLKTEKGQHYAEIVGNLFTARLQEFAGKMRVGSQEAGTGTRTDRINDERIATPEPRRVRDKDHLRFVASQPCLVCGRVPSQAHHIRHAQPRAMSRKASDEWAVPLCATHHRALHDFGDEKRWWKERKIDPIAEATGLWHKTRGVQEEKGQTTRRVS